MVFKKGQKPWNKGLTKETDERISKYSKKVKQYMSQFKTYEERYGIEKAKEIRKNQKLGLKLTDKEEEIGCTFLRIDLRGVYT